MQLIYNFDGTTTATPSKRSTKRPPVPSRVQSDGLLGLRVHLDSPTSPTTARPLAPLPPPTPTTPVPITTKSKTKMSWTKSKKKLYSSTTSLSPTSFPSPLPLVPASSTPDIFFTRSSRGHVDPSSRRSHPRPSSCSNPPSRSSSFNDRPSSTFDTFAKRLFTRRGRRRAIVLKDDENDDDDDDDLDPRKFHSSLLNVFFQCWTPNDVDEDDYDDEEEESEDDDNYRVARYKRSSRHEIVTLGAPKKRRSRTFSSSRSQNDDAVNDAQIDENDVEVEQDGDGGDGDGKGKGRVSPISGSVGDLRGEADLAEDASSTEIETKFPPPIEDPQSPSKYDEALRQSGEQRRWQPRQQAQSPPRDDFAAKPAAASLARAVSTPLPGTTPISIVGVVSRCENGEMTAFKRNEMDIEEKVQKAMELVTAHLIAAVREEVTQHQEQIEQLKRKQALLLRENSFLKAHLPALDAIVVADQSLSIPLCPSPFPDDDGKRLRFHSRHFC